MIDQDRILQCEQEIMQAFMDFEGRTKDDYKLYKKLIAPVLELSSEAGDEIKSFNNTVRNILCIYTNFLVDNNKLNISKDATGELVDKFLDINYL